MSKHVIYDIGTKILFETCFATKMLFSLCKSMILNPLPKQDLKHFSKIDILGFAAIVSHTSFPSSLKHMMHRHDTKP